MDESTRPSLSGPDSKMLRPVLATLRQVRGLPRDLGVELLLAELELAVEAACSDGADAGDVARRCVQERRQELARVLGTATGGRDAMLLQLLADDLVRRRGGLPGVATQKSGIEATTDEEAAREALRLALEPFVSKEEEAATREATALAATLHGLFVNWEDVLANMLEPMSYSVSLVGVDLPEERTRLEHVGRVIGESYATAIRVMDALQRAAVLLEAADEAQRTLATADALQAWARNDALAVEKGLASVLNRTLPSWLHRKSSFRDVAEEAAAAALESHAPRSCMSPDDGAIPVEAEEIARRKSTVGAELAGKVEDPVAEVLNHVGDFFAEHRPTSPGRNTLSPTAADTGEGQDPVGSIF